MLRCLRYMHDVEHHTVCYLRDLLVDPAPTTRPGMTAFLTFWACEEFWHGEAIATCSGPTARPPATTGSRPCAGASG